MGGVKSNVQLGVPICEDDGRLVIYAKAHAALTAFVPYAIHPSYNDEDLDQDGSDDDDGIAVTAAPATLAVGHYIGVPQKDYDSGDIAKLVIGGAGQVKVGAEAVVQGDYLEVINAGVVANVDGTSGSTTRTVNSFAMAAQANASAAATINVQFIGIPVQVAAS